MKEDLSNAHEQAVCVCGVIFTGKGIRGQASKNTMNVLDKEGHQQLGHSASAQAGRSVSPAPSPCTHLVHTATKGRAREGECLRSMFTLTAADRLTAVR